IYPSASSCSSVVFFFQRLFRVPPQSPPPRLLHRRRSMGSSSDLPTKEANVLRGHEGAVLAVRFNGDGNYCLSCGKDRTLRLWNPHRGIHIKTYKSHGREVRDVHVTHDNAKLCSCGGDRQIFYWDVVSGRVIRKFRGHDSEVNSVKFNEYGSVVVSAGYDRSVRAWDCRSQSTEPIQVETLYSVMSIWLTKNEIIAGSVDGTVRTFDIRIGREVVDELGQPVNCISLSNDGNCVLAGSLDSTLRLLDRSNGELLQEYKGHTCKALHLKSFKMDCCLTNTDAHVTGGSEDGYIFFWDLVDASVVSRFRAHASVVKHSLFIFEEFCDDYETKLEFSTALGLCCQLEKAFLNDLYRAVKALVSGTSYSPLTGIGLVSESNVMLMKTFNRPNQV
ncbi:hypothetical protein Taro_022393, partial [Colocasia esculenta]|nr:hypothetical protein [Colocasia esculenta]